MNTSFIPDVLCNINDSFISDGVYISLVGISVVFSALVVLMFVFSMLPKILNMNKKKTVHKPGQKVEKPVSISAEMNAAVSTAIYLYFHEMHDDESLEMTIKKIQKSYSPWSSKIYSMNSIDK